MARPSYTAEFKAEAVALAVEHGPAEAARATGVKAGTIRAWCSRAGVVTATAETMREARDQIVLTHEVRRATLAERLLLEAEQAVELEMTKLAGAKLYELVGARTRAIHDHQLLTGQATGRVEQTAGAALETFDELAARRKSA